MEDENYTNPKYKHIYMLYVFNIEKLTNQHQLGHLEGNAGLLLSSTCSNQKKD